ncbi:DUF1501 domain-containing protein [Chelatococcus sp. SYSU_G07232]|uniref:DUF1501 domain-containing protein n=2 Tax=Chelatococcus albus TaxID=3047466 RepID=A0ABT7AIP5_9HYPH|nr:DUF1501 domain-containing protein [Chelatococcus sp. SYSU_G07232]MDJ1159257.1 DUF1501 domain-containing protein [Chelatococcus sp. SYSU_G07232]
MPSLSRRRLLGTAGALFAWAYMPRFAFAAGGRDARFACIVLRGALDGLAAVAPVGDPDYPGLHGDLALLPDGPVPALPLDGFFALHPAMPTFARLYGAKQAVVVHAVATPYRERSHFDGQDVLESGEPRPGRAESGWLNRLAASLPPGEAVARRGCLGVGAMAPLIARGPAPAMGWAPATLPRAGEDLAGRLLDLYAARDPLLARALAQGLETDRLASSQGMGAEVMRARGGPDNPQGMRQIAEGAARLIAAADGPRIAALAFEGWDTHAREGGATGRLAQLLGGLDGAIAALEEGLRPCWKDTVVMIVTEFGRTARINGTAGTDHGTGTVAFLVGGAVNGGRVVADWPGLKPAALYEGRDLRPTADLRAVAKGVLADLFGVSAATLAERVFPESAAVAPMRGLVA